MIDNKKICLQLQEKLNISFLAAMEEFLIKPIKCNADFHIPLSLQPSVVDLNISKVYNFKLLRKF